MVDEKLNFKQILPIFTIVFVDVLGLSIIIPLLPLYSAAFGANAFVIGLLSATYPAMQFVGSLVLGNFSDRFGRKPVLIVSQIGTLIGFLVLGSANALWLLFLSRVIDGLSGANIVTAKAAITDSTSEKTRTQGLGLIGAAFGIGFVIGPAISGITLGLANGNFRAPAYVAAAFSLTSLLLTTFWFKETYDPKAAKETDEPKDSFFQKAQRAIRHPVISSLLFLLFMQQLVLNGFEQLLPLFTLNRVGLGGQGNALLFVFMGLVLAVVQGRFLGPLSRYFGEKRLIHISLILLAVGLIGISIIPEQPVPGYTQASMIERLQASTSEYDITVELPEDGNNGLTSIAIMLVMLVPTTIGGYIIMPTINSLVTQNTQNADIGSVLGVSTAVVSIGRVAAPILGGFLFRTFGSTAPFLAGGILVGILALIYVQLRISAPNPNLQPMGGD